MLFYRAKETELTEEIKKDTNTQNQLDQLLKQLSAVISVISILQTSVENNYQLTTEQNARLVILKQQLGLSSFSYLQVLATQQFAETLN